MALSVFKKKHDGCLGNRKTLPPQILLMRLKISTEDFVEIEAVMRNSPSCLNGLDFNTKLPELSLGNGVIFTNT
ncbi:hypothetical protein HMPREF2865_05510 [Neisseria sp. HMSC073G10]|uniref:hypothetical protein n=1 Tax=Neisseria sp. HMSC073G10 TaxID=1739369 RepID=UPI0008A3374C|nr:hypothetical protein [Neisseria sp. HMSC073G10]OFR84831.1 hypothetical protein HMPREF2865_05510 [Neisseria sp. HMSC073G10]